MKILLKIEEIRDVQCEQRGEQRILQLGSPGVTCQGEVIKR